MRAAQVKDERVTLPLKNQTEVPPATALHEGRNAPQAYPGV